MVSSLQSAKRPRSSPREQRPCRRMTGRPLCPPTAPSRSYRWSTRRGRNHRGDLVHAVHPGKSLATGAVVLPERETATGTSRGHEQATCGRAERPPQRGPPVCCIVVRRCCNLQRSWPTMRILTARYQATGHHLAWRPRPSGAECSRPFHLTRRVFSRDGLYVNSRVHQGRWSASSVPGAAKRGNPSRKYRDGVLDRPDVSREGQGDPRPRSPRDGPSPRSRSSPAPVDLHRRHRPLRRSARAHL
jgi:hypothetical protein